MIKTTEDILGGGIATKTTIGTGIFTPGGGRYHLIWGHVPDINDPDGPLKFICTWMNRGGGGVTVMHQIGTFCHWTYVDEKMGVGEENAKAIAHFINSVNFFDYKPENYLADLPRGVKGALS